MLAALRILAPLILGITAPAAWAQGAPRQMIYGNYCGPGNNAPLPPIDALDAACMHHDACSPDNGLPSRACNARLEREARIIADDPRQPEEQRSMAGLVSMFGAIAASGPDPIPVAVAPPPVRREPVPLVRKY